MTTNAKNLAETINRQVFQHAPAGILTVAKMKAALAEQEDGSWHCVVCGRTYTAEETTCPHCPEAPTDEEPDKEVTP